LEATNSELKNDLRDLYITSAQEIDVSSSRKAIVIHVSPAADHRTVCRHALLAQLRQLLGRSRTCPACQSLAMATSRQTGCVCPAATKWHSGKTLAPTGN